MNLPFLPSSLRQLDLSYNLLTELPDLYLPDLERLKLTGNPWTSLPNLSAWASHTNLRVHLKFEPEDLFRCLTKDWILPEEKDSLVTPRSWPKFEKVMNKLLSLPKIWCQKELKRYLGLYGEFHRLRKIIAQELVEPILEITL